MNRDAVTFRTITLTEFEAETVFEILAASVRKFHPVMTDDELVAAITLRNRFLTEGDQ